ncbi:transcription termination/antitermination protein NusA [Candidatus Uhrbacteria bacterium]|nr:transcription termination/antitermination protein NusA [Candidatus Uhrbacteria bacterium]
MASPIVQAIKQICEEKGLAHEQVLQTVEAALAAAYRKDFGHKNQNIKVEFDPETGAMRAFDVKIVVRDFSEEELEAQKKKEEEPAQNFPAVPSAGVPGAEQENSGGLVEEKFNPKTMLMVSEARAIKPNAELGEELRIELEIPHAFGRMAAQTAKQVITQRLREAERQTIFEEWSGKGGTIVTGILGRQEGRLQLVDFGRTSAILPLGEQIERESYRAGERMKFYVKSVAMGSKGPEIVLSRTDPAMVAELFRLEIPEVQSGVVEVKGVAREAGARSKIAVVSHDENIDPIGSCIGQRGGRIQTIIAEIGGEKIDVVQWSEDADKFIAASLAPAKVKKVAFDEETKTANVTVLAEELSLAIGRAGQNVRLASKLTGWKINILGEGGAPITTLTPEEGTLPPGEPAATPGEVSSESSETSKSSA